MRLSRAAGVLPGASLQVPPMLRISPPSTK
jgi:hypothetical protein